MKYGKYEYPENSIGEYFSKWYNVDFYTAFHTGELPAGERAKLKKGLEGFFSAAAKCVCRNEFGAIPSEVPEIARIGERWVRECEEDIATADEPPFGRIAPMWDAICGYITTACEREFGVRAYSRGGEPVEA